MKLDKRLTLQIPIYDDEGKSIVAYIHSTPLPEQSVERYFLTLGQTWNQIFSQGLGITAGPGNAMRLLRRIAENTGTWAHKDGSPGDAQLLVEEMRRLTMVIVPDEDKKGGWSQVPLHVAVDRSMITAEDKAEVENAIVFFICASATLPRSQRREMVSSAAEIWSAQTSSLSSTEFMASLKTSTATGNTGAKSPAPAPEPSGHATAKQDGKPASVPR